MKISSITIIISSIGISICFIDQLNNELDRISKFLREETVEFDKNIVSISRQMHRNTVNLF